MKYYLLEVPETGHSEVLSERQGASRYGKVEWMEIKAGYLPHLIVVETDGPDLQKAQFAVAQQVAARGKDKS